ncbi:MAG: hypothetical protein CMH94_08125, partial [Oceanicaulis sp.]|nr:hypothetical protein [Oceanicaulis sp.]
ARGYELAAMDDTVIVCVGPFDDVRRGGGRRLAVNAGAGGRAGGKSHKGLAYHFSFSFSGARKADPATGKGRGAPPDP